MIKEKIDEIIEKYYNETDDCYNSFYCDDYETEFCMEEEIENLFKGLKVDFKIESKSGYSNCAYDSDFLAVAWIENGKLNMRTVLLEQY